MQRGTRMPSRKLIVACGDQPKSHTIRYSSRHLQTKSYNGSLVQWKTHIVKERDRLCGCPRGKHYLQAKRIIHLKYSWNITGHIPSGGIVETFSPNNWSKRHSLHGSKLSEPVYLGSSLLWECSSEEDRRQYQCQDGDYDYRV